MESIKGKKRIGILIFVSIFSLFLYASKAEYNLAIEEQKSLVTKDLNTIRAQIEGQINSRLLLSRGLVGYIQTHPELTQEEFVNYASRIYSEDDPIIRSIAVLKGTVITYVFPNQYNEEAIGEDLMEVPDQRQSVMKAIIEGDIVLTDPVELVQGGVGLIGRMPIKIEENGYKNRLWGLISIVFDIEELLKESGIDESEGVVYAIRRLDESGLGPKHIWGNESVYVKKPIYLEMDFPSVTWQLVAAPVDGWDGNTYGFTFLLLTGIAVAMISGLYVMDILGKKETLDKMVYIDQLTGLNNRLILDDRLEMAIHRAQRYGSKVAVIFLDVNGFKEINDNYGHLVGDQLLIEVGNRLNSIVRTTDTLIRFGGDEFIIIMPDLTDEEDLQSIYSQILSAFSESFIYKNTVLKINISYGASVFPDDGNDIDGLLKIADMAMYRNKMVSKDQRYGKL